MALLGDQLAMACDFFVVRCLRLPCVFAVIRVVDSVGFDCAAARNISQVNISQDGNALPLVVAAVLPLCNGFGGGTAR
jgi:hypothetical protein